MAGSSDPMDCSPPGSSVHGIFQAKVLEWGAIAFSTLGASIVFPGSDSWFVEERKPSDWLHCLGSQICLLYYVSTRPLVLNVEMVTWISDPPLSSDPPCNQGQSMIDPKTKGLTSVAFHAKTIFAFYPLCSLLLLCVSRYQVYRLKMACGLL